MRRKTRTKVKKWLKIVGIVVGIVLLIIGIILLIKLSKGPKISYEDGIVCKNYFTEITIDLKNKKVKRDDIETSLLKEFEITEEQENLGFTSEEEMKNLFSNSTFEINVENQVVKIKNPYQTKCFIVKTTEVAEKAEGEEITKLSDNLYLLSFYSEKLTKAMYNYYKNKPYIEQIYLDEVYIDDPITDISQTVYGDTPIDLKGYHFLGTTKLGLDNYKKIINDNGNPAEVVISTIGYGINYENEFFNNRLNENYYNFMFNNKDIKETIGQGSRIAEVIVDSTTSNVKLLPLVTVTEEGYTSLSSILKALNYSIQNADIICFELINPKHETINILLEEAFYKNKPVCAASTENKENYPANHGMTIAVSSLDRENNVSDYSSNGDFIDFALPSTDIEEIFNKNSTVSRWSGAQYSNAGIASIIAMVKTYNKEATILDIYNFLRDFSIDLGSQGKDNQYGYGIPNFSGLKISDIDKKSPEYKEITYENQTWEILKQVKISASDNIRIYRWAITKNEGEPNQEEWNILESVTPNLDIAREITENGKYFIWVQDTAGNNVIKDIQVDKVDNKPPQIAYTINKDTLSSGYVTINVTAEDSESGLYDSPFSWDNRIWSQENSTRVVKENGIYKVYAEDNLGNISELDIIVDVFPQEGRAELEEGNIITSVKVSADWNENTNNNVEITLNKDINITGWQITTNSYAPSDFVEVPQPTIQNNVNENNRNNNNDQNNVSLPGNMNWDRYNSRTNTTNNTTQNSIDTNTMNNTTSTNTTNNTTQNLTNLNTTNSSRTSNTEENVEPQPVQRTEPIIINMSLNLDIDYYLWVKDSQNNTWYQKFKIMKGELTRK